MPTTDVGLDDTLQDNEVGIPDPVSEPMPPGAGAATMPAMTPRGAPPSPPMDSMITDFLIRKFGGGGVQGANAPPPMPPMPPPAPQRSNDFQNTPTGGPAPAVPPLPLPQRAMPAPRSGSANAAPMPPQAAPSPPQRPLTMQDLTRRGALQDYLPAVVNAFLPTPEARSGSATGSANANPGASAIPPTLTPSPASGSATAAPSSAAPPGSAPASSSWMDIIKNALKYSVGSGGRSDNLGALQYSIGSGGRDSAPAAASGKGSANANPGGSTTYPPKDTGATGDEFAARRQGEKIGPPNTQPYTAKPSTRFTKPYARGGAKEGQRPPAQKQQARAQAPRGVGASAPMQTKRASAAPQTARSGRSAYAQSLIDSMGPRGAGVTTYIEPATGNEILTGNGIYQNLGKTSTGTSKPAFTKFFS